MDLTDNTNEEVEQINEELLYEEQCFKCGENLINTGECYMCDIVGDKTEDYCYCE